MAVRKGTVGRDRLRGTVRKDRILGFDDHDQLAGLKGNDLLYGGFGNDRISGNRDNDRLFGQGDRDVLRGGGGDDLLNGGEDVDTLLGGLGNDTYVVDGGDRLRGETRRGGIDTVQVGFNFVLRPGFENLELTGRAEEGRGNRSANQITGNAIGNRLFGNGGADVLKGMGGSDTLEGGSGADLLDGGAGKDKMYGGSGNDTYVISSVKDRLGESMNGGVDTIQTAQGIALPRLFENLTLVGKGRMAGVGNTADNRLIGNEGDSYLYGREGNDLLEGRAGNDELEGEGGSDRLIGGEGNDILTGQAGADWFVFDASTAAVNQPESLGLDTITDFEVGVDKIVLSATTFTALADGTVNGKFAIATTDAAAMTSPAALVYNSANGRLFYNPDGAGMGGVAIATLNGNPVLSATDFMVQPSLVQSK